MYVDMGARPFLTKCRIHRTLTKTAEQRSHPVHSVVFAIVASTLVFDLLIGKIIFENYHYSFSTKLVYAYDTM